MPKSKVGVTLRIEVRDDRGRVVNVIETPSRSFTQNFANILFASMWTAYTLTNMLSLIHNLTLPTNREV